MSQTTRKLHDLLRGRSQHSLIILQCSPEQSAMSLLWKIINTSVGTIVTVNLLHASLPLPSSDAVNNVVSLDYTNIIPGYTHVPSISLISSVIETIRNVNGPITLVIDSLSTLTLDLESSAGAHAFLREVLNEIDCRPRPSRMIIRAEAQSETLKHIKATSFAPNTLYIGVYNPSLLHYISQSYFVSPPTGIPPTKFWQVFIPMTERNEGFKVSYGSNGSFEDFGEAVLHVVDHFRGSSRGPVEQTLEGWANKQPCELSMLQSLKGLRNTMTDSELQSTQDLDKLSFNLTLTDSQQLRRSQVPLPYAHTKESTATQIIYDPDSADDFDDDDPDDDLDI